MTRLVGVHEAKTHLSRLINEASAGEEIIVTRGGVPVAKLTPLRPAAERQVGFVKGRLTPAFFECLAEEDLAAWE
ncbi:MAG: type II toxin-antitoxin system prevent-host-death family antitoxin [Acidobacteria bacterium]|nr:type II toxin-antitoxin system prevent-host-death family antitoxin [Acidobacteriota bacterium]